MRRALKQLNGERRRFTGTFVRLGKKNGWKGITLTTLPLKDIKDAFGKIVCDHIWFNMTKEFGNLVLKEGTVIGFDARVKEYYKGYRGYREDIDKPVERDFRLANPTKVQVIPYSAQYEADVRKLQETISHQDPEKQLSAKFATTLIFTNGICPICKKQVYKLNENKQSISVDVNEGMNHFIKHNDEEKRGYEERCEFLHL